MTTSIATNQLQKSYGRCCGQTEFFDDFYNTFLASSPLLPKMFARTDMAAQKDLLRSEISYLLMYARGEALAKTKVEGLAKSHGRTGFNIKPEYYSLWVESLMKTIAKHDSKFSPEVDKEWRQALDKGITAMKAGF